MSSPSSPYKEKSLHIISDTVGTYTKRYNATKYLV